MKRRLLLFLSLSLNAGLVATLWYVWTWPEPVVPPTLPARVLRIAEAGPNDRDLASTPPGTTNVPTSLRWAELASTNFFAYRDHLRAVGCPEKTIRDILESEINEEFRLRRQPIVDSIQQRFWDLVAEGGKDGFEAAEDQFRVLNQERRELITAVLGSNQPDPLAEEASRRASYAERYEWAPPELRAQLVDLDTELWRQQRVLQSEVAGREDKTWTQLDHARRQHLAAEHAAARRELLGNLAGEFDLRNGNAAHWARWLVGFEPTEVEWREVATATAALETARQQLESPAPTGTAEAVAAAREGREVALARAEAAYQAQLAAALSPERLAEYERASDAAYQQTRRVTQRLGLGDDLAAQAREIQRAALEAAEQLRGNASLDDAARQAALREIQAEATRSLRGTLGERGLQPYQEYAGDWLKQLAPEK